MEVIYIVLPLALIIVGAAVAAYVWSVRDGQLDDLESPPVRMLFDDEVSRRTPRSPSVNPDR
ncbi:MAG: hypothetical protein GMKNLPBB_00771 [Myxococcota bacterium]|nr:hypothetical protein [Myxococcota bacterium]